MIAQRNDCPSGGTLEMKSEMGNFLEKTKSAGNHFSELQPLEQFICERNERLSGKGLSSDQLEQFIPIFYIYPALGTALRKAN